MEFYTDCRCIGNNVLLRGIRDGKKFQEKVPFSPSLYVKDKNAKDSKFKTIFGEPLKEMKFSNISESWDFRKRYDGIDNMLIYGNTAFEYVYLSQRYGGGHLEFDKEQLTIVNIDIEVGSEHGFPKAEEASQPVVAITMKVKDRYYVLGIGDYTPHREDVEYKKFVNEEALLRGFLTFWERLAPHIVTGWYIGNFDIPYLINRIANLMDTDEADRLSPWGIIKEGTTMSKGKQVTPFDIVGVAILDYIDLYKKFSEGSSQESYTLNHISYIELGAQKISYEEFGSLHKLFKLDYQKFIEYNIRDVELVSMLDKKLDLISLVLNIAYDAKVNHQDVFSQVRMWDMIICNDLSKKGIQVPPKKRGETAKEKYEGAYVRPPVPGGYNWVISFDLDSEYPMSMVQWNISPETMHRTSRIEFPASNDDIYGTAHVEPSFDRVAYILAENFDPDFPIKNNLTMAANGYYFTKEKRGFLPAIIMRMYEDRLAFKDKKKEVSTHLRDVELEMKSRGLSLSE